MADKKESKFMAPLELSQDLTAVIGKGPYPRTKVVKLLWAYIKENNLQDPKNKRNILPDDKLAKVFGTSDSVNMFEMNRLVSGHLS
jgi:chromatin remodeling complex protein RSC6